MAWKTALALLLLGFAAPPRAAELKVLPWNGSKGAVSFTFDDGDASHLGIVIPELDRRKLRATFFLITSQIGNGGAWKKAAAAGHEMASHSATHRNPSGFKPEEEESEITGAAKNLEQAFGHPVASFAYPFCAVTPGLRAKIEKVHLLARGGSGNPIPLEGEPDWLNLPSQATCTEGKLETYQGWIDAALQKGAWSIFMIHGVETSGYSPIKKAAFGGILDHLKDKDLWVAPFGEVGAYLKAQKVFEKTPGSSGKWEWKVPPVFPKGVLLKVKPEAGQELSQKDGPLRPDAKGFCSFKFDEGSLTLRPKR
ncbi:MAG: polysaccharide deacetylase family protein [Planctomycetes bacterium]|nr:polysaccharide deacetylase family protein [Planctomycetota bacterium]